MVAAEAASASPRANKSRRRQFWFRLTALFMGLSFAFIVVEVALRLYSPFALRIRGSQINLPLNTQTVFKNENVSKLDEEITHSRNSIGFRGPNPPDDFGGHLTLVTVGGSTTECFYLSDDFTWSAQLQELLKSGFSNVWVNNAGLDGHSTFGHLHLLDQYLVALRPDYVVYLIGLNDVGTERELVFDEQLRRMPEENSSVLKWCYLSLVEHSACVALIDNIRRQMQADDAGVTHGNIDHEQLQLAANGSQLVAPGQAQEMLDEHARDYVPGFRQRVETLVKATRAHGIEPVLVTQPTLYGPAVDHETGVNLGGVNIDGISGDLKWQIVELYNDVTRNVASTEEVLLIDLAVGLPKDSRLYYDWHHFTNAGAKEVATILAKELEPFLKSRRQID